MDIKEQFDLVAKEYDANRKKFIPCFDDYYEGTTKFIAAGIASPKRILDLGAGTGLLTYYWYRHFPKSEYVLVDVSEEMLKIAHKRFNGIGTIRFQIADYANALPKEDFDVIISALSIHHLENDGKTKLFERVYEKLPKGGVFVNYDQFCAGQAELNTWFESYWENQMAHSGLTAHDIELWKERRTLDRECSVEQEIEMLCKCKFHAVKCVYSCQKFSVIVAIK